MSIALEEGYPKKYFCYFSMNICYVFSLEAPQQSTSNEYL